MNGLSCFKPEIFTPVGEIVMHVIYFPADVVENKSDDTWIIYADQNELVSSLLQKTRGAHKISYEIELVFGGRILDPSEPIPQDAFEPFDVTDGMSLMFRSRITVVILADQPLFPVQANNNIVDITKQIAENEQLEKENQQRREQELYEQQLIGQSDVHIENSKFSLSEQLAQIECGMFHTILKENGFDQEGTFAMLSEEDFYVLNINVPLRAKNRILELSRNIKDGIIQRTASQTKEDANAKAHVSKRPTKPAKVVKGEILQVTVNVFEEKVLRIKQRIQATLSESTLPIMKIQDITDSIPCCLQHHEKVDERKLKIRSINKVKFTAEIASRLDWLEHKNSLQSISLNALAPFEEMFLIFWSIAQRWGTRGIQREEAYQTIEKQAALSIQELHAIEDIYPVQEVAGQYSVVSGYLYAKDKFIDTVVNYLETVDPLFFIKRE